jgi:hypothetical protein
MANISAMLEAVSKLRGKPDFSSDGYEIKGFPARVKIIKGDQLSAS